VTCGGSVSSIGDSMGSGGVNTVVADPIGEYSAVVVVAALILCVMVGGRLAIAASGVGDLHRYGLQSELGVDAAVAMSLRRQSIAWLREYIGKVVVLSPVSWPPHRFLVSLGIR